MTTEIKQQNIMLSETSQGEKDKYYMFSCVEAKKIECQEAELEGC